MQLYHDEEKHLHERRDDRLMQRDNLIELLYSYHQRLEKIFVGGKSNEQILDWMETFRSEMKYDAESWKSNK